MHVCREQRAERVDVVRPACEPAGATAGTHARAGRLRGEPRGPHLAQLGHGEADVGSRGAPRNITITTLYTSSSPPPLPTFFSLTPANIFRLLGGWGGLQFGGHNVHSR